MYARYLCARIRPLGQACARQKSIGDRVSIINYRETWSTIMGPVYNSRYPILTLVCKIPLLARRTRPKAHGLAAAIRPSARANKDILLHLTRCISRKCEIGGQKRRRARKIGRWLGFKYLAYNNGTHRWSMRARDMLVAWGKMNIEYTNDRRYCPFIKILVLASATLVGYVYHLQIDLCRPSYGIRDTVRANM